MKTKIFLLTALFVAALCTSVKAETANKLVYNPILENGVTVGQTVYKMQNDGLANYMKHSYKYDNQERMIEKETYVWNNELQTWNKDLKITYSYNNNSVKATSFKWNAKTNQYSIIENNH